MAFAEPCLFADGGGTEYSAATGRVGSVSVTADYFTLSDATCRDSSLMHGWLPFVFGVPQTLTVDFYAEAWVGLGPGLVRVGAVGEVMFTGFRFFDAQRNLLTGISSSFVPAEPLPLPEPGTFPILAAIAATAVAVRARHRKDSGEVSQKLLKHRKRS